ncbi:MAG: hypothetical protein GF416_01625 [Candidatus Altiarchaeales archaeon]|nr:hypothetical protein [Candidatus Altiarchaeales archaeon]MBD3415815.1 hypothetical protein [Candidatus Altiarchaeales archaeon]
MKVLITAGPTREHIDDIRFISNPSSGATGIALAEEAVKRGFEVAIVLGPTSLQPIYGVKVIPVVSSAEMTEKTLAELDKGYDMLVSTAALADYTPVEKVDGKIRSGKDITLKLKPTRKLIRDARERNPDLKIVAFKAEYRKREDELIEAGRKLLDTSDLVVVNDVSNDVFGSDETEVYMVGESVKHIKRAKKREVAKEIFDALS